MTDTVDRTVIKDSWSDYRDQHYLGLLIKGKVAGAGLSIRGDLISVELSYCGDTCFITSRFDSPLVFSMRLETTDALYGEIMEFMEGGE